MPGHPLTWLQCLWVGKGSEDEPLWRPFQQPGPALLHLSSGFCNGNPSTVIGEYITTGWTVSTHTTRISEEETHNMRCRELRPLSWPVIGYSPYFRILRSDFWERSAACCAMLPTESSMPGRLAAKSGLHFLLQQSTRPHPDHSTCNRRDAKTECCLIMLRPIEYLINN